MTELRIDGERLWQSLMTMAEIGATAKGGVCRLTLTDEDKRGRDLFRQWCEEAGLQVRIMSLGGSLPNLALQGPKSREALESDQKLVFALVKSIEINFIQSISPWRSNPER